MGGAGPTLGRARDDGWRTAPGRLSRPSLRRAYGNPRADGRVRQNLALVVGLQGRFAEAETIAKGDLPAEEAQANVTYLREMLSQKDPRGRKPPVVALDKQD